MSRGDNSGSHCRRFPKFYDHIIHKSQVHRKCLFFWGGREPWEKPPNMWLPSKERSHQKPIKREFPENHGTSKVPAGRGYVIVSRRVTGPGLNILQSIDLWLPLFLRKMIWCRFGDDRFHETLCQRWFRIKTHVFREIVRNHSDSILGMVAKLHLEFLGMLLYFVDLC